MVIQEFTCHLFPHAEEESRWAPSMEREGECLQDPDCPLMDRARRCMHLPASHLGSPLSLLPLQVKTRLQSCPMDTPIFRCPSSLFVHEKRVLWGSCSSSHVSQIPSVPVAGEPSTRCCTRTIAGEPGPWSSSRPP